MEPESLLLHSQEPATCFYPESDRSNPCPLSHVSKIHFNIILPSTPGSSKRSPLFRFPHQNSVCTCALFRMCYVPCPSHSFRFDHANNIWWGIQSIKLPVSRQVHPAKYLTSPLSLAVSECDFPCAKNIEFIALVICICWFCLRASFVIAETGAVASCLMSIDEK